LPPCAEKEWATPPASLARNHLGDKNEFLLPTVHGFDEFSFGYLYPPRRDWKTRRIPAYSARRLLNTVGPRQPWSIRMRPMSTNATVDPRWGKVGKTEDRGCRNALSQADGKPWDDEIRDLALKFIDKAKADNKPFFLWLNPTRMHIVTPPVAKVRGAAQLPERLEPSMRPAWRQLDDDVRHRDAEETQRTWASMITPSWVFTTDNGTEVFTWPGRRNRRLFGAARGKGTVFEGGFRVPAMIRWPGKVPGGQGLRNGSSSPGWNWFPTFLAAAGNPNIVDELKKGKADRRHDLQMSSGRL